MMKKFVIGIAFSLLIQSSLINVYADEPSSWAKNEIVTAIEKGLVPEQLQCNYTQNITREEFCKLCMAVINSWENDIDFGNNESIKFTDTTDKDILSCAKLGIVSGVGNDKFAPKNSIKRQEAARMLYNTLNVATPVISESHGKATTGFYSCCVPHSFNDGGLIKSWARNEINHLYRFGVMFGVSDNNYNPDGYYTREQAICTFLRLYYCFGNMENNSIQKDYFPNKETAEDYLSDGLIQIDSYNLYDKNSYIAQYIDNDGNIYNQNDKGYIYPFDMKYGVIESTAPGMRNIAFLIDKNGNIFCNNNSGWDKIEINEDTILFANNRESIYRLYKIPNDNSNIEDNIIIESNLYISYIGDGLYSVAKENNKMSVIDVNGNFIIDDIDTSSQGYVLNINSYNNIFVAKYQNKEYAVIKYNNSKAEVIRNFNVPDSWEFVESVGSNINFYDSKNDKHILYRAVSGKYYEYNQVSLTENNEAIAYAPNFHYYILNSDGSIKFDAGKLGYKNVSKIYGFDFYKVLKDNGESNLFDIVDKNGKIIKTNISSVNSDLVLDKSGLCAYFTPEKIYFFDFFGTDICQFDLSQIYGDTSANKKINSIKFINGLLWVNITDSLDNSLNESFYVMPNGQVINLG